MRLRAAILVVSDRVSAGKMQDKSGPAAEAALAGLADIIGKAVVPDECGQIEQTLLAWCDGRADVIFTLGGTGFSPRDVTPEATRTVIEREAPGLIVGLVANGLSKTPRAMLSRAVAGLCGRTLIINLPGSVSAVRESIEYLSGVLPHAVEMMAGGGHG